MVIKSVQNKTPEEQSTEDGLDPKPIQELLCGCDEIQKLKMRRGSNLLFFLFVETYRKAPLLVARREKRGCFQGLRRGTYIWYINVGILSQSGETYAEEESDAVTGERDSPRGRQTRVFSGHRRWPRGPFHAYLRTDLRNQLQGWRDPWHIAKNPRRN